MRNRKRDLNGYKKQFGRYRLTRKNIMVLEKVLWEYADAREMKLSNIDQMPQGRKHMPRKFADRHITVGDCQVDSVKFLPKSIERTRYMEVACKPGITITFTPRSTVVYAQTHYATGAELRTMKKVLGSLEAYFATLQKSIFNIIDFSK